MEQGPESLSESPAGIPEGFDHKLPELERIISHLLRAGVILSSATILLGVMLMVFTRSTGYGAVGGYHLGSILRFHSHSAAEFPVTVAGVVLGALALKPFAIIMTGALLLIATPVLRVAVSLVTFLLERDWAYVAISLYVLIVLIVSFLIGRSIG